MGVPKAFSYMRSCELCNLSKSRTQVVIGRGPWKNVKYMFIGEAPGENEDAQGQPFVGKAGSRLEEMMALAEVSQDDVYITNMVKCLSGGTRVLLPDGTTQRINRLVKKDYRGKVLSFDQEAEMFVPRRVLATHRTRLGKRYWMRVSYRGAKGNVKGSVGATVTNDHEFLTDRGVWVRADKLDGKNILIGPGLSRVGLDVSIGMLLGDGGMAGNTGASLVCCHSDAQEEWARLKAGVFGVPIDLQNHYVKAIGRKYPRVCFRVPANRHLSYLKHEFYGKNGKKIPNWLPDEFNLMMAAVWYLDDGYVSKSGKIAEFASHSFDSKGRKTLVRCLAQLGIESYQRKKAPGRIFLNVSNTRLLFEKIACFVPESMRYKLGDQAGLSKFNQDLWQSGEPMPFYAKAIVSKVKKAGKKDDLAYCLTVDGTENFITQAGVVHNCRPPENRKPSAREVKSCSVHLLLQIKIVKPQMLVLIGNTTLQYFFPTLKIMSVHGKKLPQKMGLPTFAVIHPAATLHNPRWTDLLLEDLKALKNVSKERTSLVIGPRVIE